MPANSVALDACGISKTFDGNLVLDQLRLQVAAGRVHALLGHNGSGKSTFIKVLAGFHLPDSGSGSILVGERELEAGNPDSSRKAGVSFVHQTLGLIPTLSVLENLRLGKPYRRTLWGSIRWREEYAAARAELAGFGLDIDPATPLDRLTGVERTCVAIVRALGADPGNNRLLVLDEPTAALDEGEVRRLFDTIRQVQRREVGVLYVSHRLEEVEQIADDVTVLRDGLAVGEGKVADFSMARLVGLISGESAMGNAARPPFVPASSTASVPRMRISGLQAGGLKALDVEAQPGEILGIVGLVGSGIEDVMPMFTAARRVEAGTLEIDGHSVSPERISSILRAGVAVVSGQRSLRVIQELSVRENLSLPVIGKYFRAGYLRRREENRDVARIVKQFGVLPRSPEAMVRTLSGGNQQKVAVARALQTQPQVLVLEEPTQGVDAGGRAEIYGLIRAAATAGCLIVAIDSDLDEVIELCTRVLVLRAGVVVAELGANQIEKLTILQACYGSDLAETLTRGDLAELVAGKD